MRVKGSLDFLAEDASWSEVLYFTASDLEAVRLAYEPIITTRLRILGNSVRIKKLRLVNIDARSLGALHNVNKPGSGGTSDTPWQAIALNINSSAGARRVYRAAGLPDSFTANAHFDGDTIIANINRSIKSEVNRFGTAMVSAGAQIAYYDRAQPKLDVASVAGDGTVTLLQNGNFSVADTIQFYRTRFDNSREAVKGRWRVSESTADPKIFKILHWPSGRTVTKGVLFKVVPLLSNFTTFSIGDTVSRTTGRPSGRQRGRRLVRR